ncbi:transposase [Acidisoma cellulosilytica]|uniref:Transposase n=1 Tax=Acidisoma cellulosilyticum TaxID=2802395 RepID=A0A963Z7T2_9PROT|nr:transposase [Acidisoma cellulosilyticum]MCB8884079.1 transposase [Acidisoma cellulosilyticum]
MDEAPDIIAADESSHTTNRRSARSARVEIITGVERRRRWTLEQKRDIVAESYGPDLTPTEVASKHGISSGQLYTWRQEVLGVRSAVLTQAAPRFATVEVAATALTIEPVAPAPDVAAVRAAACSAGRMEIVLPGDIHLRIDAQVDRAALRRVLDALRWRLSPWHPGCASIWPAE